MQRMIMFLFGLLAINSAQGQLPDLILPIGHTDWINSVAFSPGGQYIASSSDDKTLKLWQVSTGQLVRTFQGHNGSVSSIAFSPNGQYVISGAWDKTLKLWQVSTGQLVRTFQGHTKDVNSVAFSSDGQYAVSGSDDKTLKLWQVSTGQLVRTFQGHNDRVSSVAFAPNGQYMISGSNDKTLKLWQVSTGQLVRTFQGHTDQVRSVAFSPNGQQIVSGSWDGTFNLWQTSTGQLLNIFQGHINAVNSVTFSSNGQYLASGSDDKTLKLWQISTGKVIYTFEGHTERVNQAVFSLDGQYIVSGSWDKTIKIWHTNTGQLMRTLRGHTDLVSSVAISPDGQYIVSGSDDNTLKLWQTSTGQLLHTFEGHINAVNSVAFSFDGQYIVSGSDDNTLKLWQTSNGQLLRTLEDHIEDIKSVAFSPDGQYLLSCSNDNTLKLWQTSTGFIIRTFEGHTERVNQAVFSLDGQYIVSGSDDKTIKIWHTNTGQLMRTLRGHTDLVSSVAISPDGQYIVSGSWDNTLKLWQTSTGFIIRTFEGHLGFVTSVDYSSDGRYIISGAWDNTSKLWQTSSGQQLASLIAVDSTDWVVTSPSGLFDASPGAQKLMHYVIQDSTNKTYPYQIINLEQIKHRYYQPGLLAILSGHSSEKLRPIPSFNGVSLPPSVKLSLQSHQLTVQLTNQKGGIGKVSVYFNGAEIIDDLRPTPKHNVSQNSLSLYLDLDRFKNRFDTLNTLKVIAYNGDGWINTLPQLIDFLPVRSSAKGTKLAESSKTTQKDSTRLYAVVVGTSNVGLHYAHKDAQQFHASLQLSAQELLGVDKVSSQLLITHDSLQSPKANILQALKEAQKVRPGDVFVMYLSGHGVNYGGVDGDFYYLTAGAKQSDAEYLRDEAIRRDFALSSHEFAQYLNLIPARKKVLILDVCAAGKLAEQLYTMRDVPSSQIRALDRLQDRTGFYVLAGSAADKASFEASRYGQGLLTYALLKGILGAALRREGSDEYVDIEKLFGYAIDEVPELAKGVQGIQKPFYRGGNEQRTFDVGKVTSVIKQKIQLAQPKPVLLVESFQEVQQSRDILRFTSKVKDALQNLKATGDWIFEYVDAVDFPDAYSLSGRYELEGEQVILTCHVFKDDVQKAQFKILGNKSNPAELAKTLVVELQKLQL